MDLKKIIRCGHLTKVFDPARRIPQHIVDELLEFLRTSASSVNVQPWHFVVADSDEGKARINKGVLEMNHIKVSTASHVIDFCTRESLSDEYIDALLNQEDDEGRFKTRAAKGNMEAVVRGWIDMHRFEMKDLQHWMEKQTYFALGMLLMAATRT